MCVYDENILYFMFTYLNILVHKLIRWAWTKGNGMHENIHTKKKKENQLNQLLQWIKLKNINNVEEINKLKYFVCFCVLILENIKKIFF